MRGARGQPAPQSNLLLDTNEEVDVLPATRKENSKRIDPDIGEEMSSVTRFVSRYREQKGWQEGTRRKERKDGERTDNLRVNTYIVFTCNVV